MPQPALLRLSERMLRPLADAYLPQGEHDEARVSVEMMKVVTTMRGPVMHRAVLAMAIFLCSALWLVLLVATHFSVISLDAGLLGVLGATGTSAASTRH